MFFAYPVDAYTHHILCGESPHYGFVDQPVVAVCANRIGTECSWKHSSHCHRAIVRVRNDCGDQAASAVADTPGNGPDLVPGVGRPASGPARSLPRLPDDRLPDDLDFYLKDHDYQRQED